jgi:hypothetical protein
MTTQAGALGRGRIESLAECEQAVRRLTFAASAVKPSTITRQIHTRSSLDERP